MNPRELIARRAAQEFKDGFVVNLGFGIPVSYTHLDVYKRQVLPPGSILVG